MMPILALAVVLQTAIAPQTAPETDIVVIGRRLAALAVVVGHDSRGRFTCDLSQSSGYSRLDDRLCRTAAKCVRAGAADQPSVTACIDARKAGLLADVRKTLAAGGRR